MFLRRKELQRQKGSGPREGLTLSNVGLYHLSADRCHISPFYLASLLNSRLISSIFPAYLASLTGSQTDS